MWLETPEQHCTRLLAPQLNAMAPASVPCPLPGAAARSYVTWKVAARYAATPEQRSQLVATAGQQLLQQLAPDLEQQLHQQAAAGGCD